MRIEVDQSGKVEDTATGTVIAFSNEKKYSILIPSTVKRECLEELRQRGRTGKSIYRRMFTIGLFLLLKGRFQKSDFTVIDVEYTGHSRSIKEHLINLLIGAGMKVDADNIQFRRIGRKSPAHDLAYLTHRGEIKTNRKITSKELIKYL